MISTVERSPDGVRSANERPVTSFSYVYDCGSERSDAFNSEMSLYRAACDGKTDVLFVSHLHADHINGIDGLQAMAPAKTVIVSYLDVVERLLFVLSDFEHGTVSRRRSTTLRAP
ncbi:MBL fold metallo-hydrolase [Rhizobium laguerreae]|nr:MBL fold metallo-hydrolase [Rhizobium laguerreae]